MRPRLSRIVDDVGGLAGQTLQRDAAGALEWATGATGGAWGDITGTLSDQTDLQTEFDGKATTGHNHDASYEPLGEVAAHVAAGDPHTVYLTAGEADALYDAINAASDAVTTHEGAVDPHTVYLRQSEADALYDAIGEAASEVATHAAASDPHTGYQRESEKNAASGYAGLSAGSKLTGSQQTYGTAADTACEGNDARLSDARTPTQHVINDSSHSFPGGTTFLRADGVFASPPGGTEAFPIGSVFLSVVSTNPGTLLGYGTWSAIAAGKMLIGLDSGDTDFDTAEETGGAKTSSAVVNHTHVVNVTDNGHVHGEQAPLSASSGAMKFGIDTNASGTQAAGINTASATTGITATTDAPAGGVASFSLMNPYFVVYVWKRTA